MRSCDHAVENADHKKMDPVICMEKSLSKEKLPRVGMSAAKATRKLLKPGRRSK